MDKLLLLIPTLSCTIFDFYRVMRPQGRITRFLFYFADMAEYSGRGRASHLAKRGSHGQGRCSALSLPVQTNRGIPARSARMTAGFGGILWSLALPLNDVHKCKCVQGAAVTWTRESYHFRHSEAAGRGIPRPGVGQYVVVTPVEPTVGFPRRARE